ncbi:hypothetical protein SAMN05661008_00466 [Alkalithermobacter thermoalcaliphilus JW-YL-7 = DSM 7308]|uniref:Uncharacterized protein n=1 Tax=Alkalithermobacter thermoalcaliphilus JW-YL-7 = DSM 7308 TaxID=1121328 RepID=A0A150FQN2_CLOPD|nr:hypothetical protein JWYL7_0425 [[Clostridium] paradoxum JW-YL-7 = DSM 7308]SHK55035.1 hypothetical protein SAMN05661008_00466 [[Clostridium] paradoxum JW-YL-7 = DSM 7308]
MDQFDKISINQISKRDMLLILKALEYTFENTKIEEFKDLKNDILQELCFLSEKTEEEFLKSLE